MNRHYHFSSLLVIVLTGLATRGFAQTVGIGATAFTPNSASILDVSSSTKGVLLPRMTSAERSTYTTSSALGVGHRGITVYNTTTNTYDYWDGSAWKVITPDALTSILAGNGLSVNNGGAVPKVELGGDLDQHTVIRANTFNLKYVVTSTPGDGRVIIGSTAYNPNDFYSFSVQRPGEGNEVRVGGADYGLLASVDEANELGILVQNSTSSGGVGFTGAIQGIMPNMNNAEGALAFNRGGRTIGVYGSVNSGANNFAGYFEYGKVYWATKINRNRGQTVNRLRCALCALQQNQRNDNGQRDKQS